MERNLNMRLHLTLRRGRNDSVLKIIFVFFFLFRLKRFVGISIPFGKISEGFKKFKTGISQVKKGYKQFKKLKKALSSSDDGDDDNSEGGALNELRDELKLLRK